MKGKQFNYVGWMLTLLFCVTFAAGQNTPGTVNFPTTLDTPDSLFRVSDKTQSTLAATVSGNATSLTVVDSATFPASGAVVIENEIIYYTGKSGNLLTGLTRGASATTATTHLVGRSTRGAILAVQHNTQSQAIISVERKLGIGNTVPSVNSLLFGDQNGASVWRTLTASDLPSLNADKITTGAINLNRLGSGTPTATTVLFGDGSWKTLPTGDGGGNTTINGGNQPALSAYSNFAAAKTAIGNVQTTLLIDRVENLPMFSSTFIPANITLQRVGAGKLVSNGSAVIQFQGNGLMNSKTTEPLFFGFGIGDVTFTGADYPRSLSSDLWAASSLSEKLNRAVASITDRYVEILATPGTLTTAVDVTAKKTIRFGAGDYGNSVPTYPQIKMFDQTALLGVKGQTRLKESSVPGNVRFVYGSSLFNGTIDGKNFDITIDGITFVGDSNQTLDTAAGTVFLGNVTRGNITNNSFQATHGFGAYVGAFGTAGNYAEDCAITDNTFFHLGTQNAGVISGKNNIVARNIFEANGLTSGGTASVAVIDGEPNSPDDRIDGLQVFDNIINIKGANVSTLCIIIQSSDAPAMTGIVVARNQCLGLDITNTFGGTRAMSVGIAVSGALYPIIENNLTVGGGQTGVEVDNSYGAIVRNNTILSHGGGGNSALGVYACAKCKVVGNIIETTLIPISQAADIREIEKTQNVNVTAGSPNVTSTGTLVYTWWIGQKVTIGNADYTVVTAPTSRTYTVSPNLAVTGTNILATTKFSSTQYIHNITSGIALAPNSRSLIYSLVADSVTAGISPTPTPTPSPTPSGGSDDADAVAYDTAAGITDTAQKAAINQLYVSLKSAGVYTKLKAGWLFATGSATKAKFNLKNPANTDAAFRLSIPTEWTFAKTGATSATRGADTHLIPANDLTTSGGVNLSYWSNTTGGGDAFDFRASSTNGTNAGHQILGKFQTTKYLSDAFSGGLSDRIIEEIGDPIGFFSDNVDGSTAHKAYKNAAQLGATRPVNNNLTDINGSYAFGGQDITSGASGREYRYAGITANLTDAEETAYYNAVNTCVNNAAWGN